MCWTQTLWDNFFFHNLNNYFRIKLKRSNLTSTTTSVSADIFCLSVDNNEYYSILLCKYSLILKMFCYWITVSVWSFGKSLPWSQLRRSSSSSSVAQACSPIELKSSNTLRSLWKETVTGFTLNLNSCVFLLFLPVVLFFLLNPQVTQHSWLITAQYEIKWTNNKSWSKQRTSQDLLLSTSQRCAYWT